VKPVDDEVVLKLRQTLNSEGWQTVMLPAIEQSIDYVKTQLGLREKERAPQFTDTPEDFMRGQLQALNWVLNIWDLNINIYERNLATAEAHAAQQEADGLTVGAPEGADA